MHVLRNSLAWLFVGLAGAGVTMHPTIAQEIAVNGNTAWEADVAPQPDGDGFLLVNDWVQVGRFVAGLDIASLGTEFQRTDCAPHAGAGDGYLLVNDWVQAGRYVAGLDAPQGQGGPENSNGTIQVILEPADAVAAGALWRLDDGSWQASHFLLTDINTGIYTIHFAEIMDWVAPIPLEIKVIPGETVIVVGLYSMTISRAIENLADAEEPTATAADNLYDAFVVEETRNGYDAAHQKINEAIEAFVGSGGDYLAFCARSEAIPPTIFTEEAVLKRRSDEALAKAQFKSTPTRIILATTLSPDAMKPDKSSVFPNVVVFVNGINTDYTDFLKNYRALWAAVKPFAARYGLIGEGIWNPTGGFLNDLALECTTQKLLEAVEYWANVPIEHDTTSYVRFRFELNISEGKNVIVVAHSQGNFHVREATDNMSTAARAHINVISVASPASYMPAGIRHQSRVDIVGDPVPDLALAVTGRFPYEGTADRGGWLSWLVSHIPGLQFPADLTDMLNRHSFEGAYLQGQARDAILQRIRDYSRTDGIIRPGEMVPVRSGWFEMGRPITDSGAFNERPLHDVFLDAYQIGKYEVTTQEYVSILNWANARDYLKDSSGNEYEYGSIYAYGQIIAHANGASQIIYAGGIFRSGILYTCDGDSSPMADHPVTYVSWFGAVAYCNWLSEQQGLQPCYDTSTWTRYEPVRNGYRLPTEAEWERAAAWDGVKSWRYGTTSDTIDFSMANFGGPYTDPFCIPIQGTSPVGWYNGNNPAQISNPETVTMNAMSPVGAYDMCGNVREWCNDWYDATYYSNSSVANPTGPASGDTRVMRDGSWWYTVMSDCRSHRRGGGNPIGIGDAYGFRIAQTP